MGCFWPDLPSVSGGLTFSLGMEQKGQEQQGGGVVGERGTGLGGAAGVRAAR